MGGICCIHCSGVIGRGKGPDNDTGSGGTNSGSGNGSVASTNTPTDVTSSSNTDTPDWDASQTSVDGESSTPDRNIISVTHVGDGPLPTGQQTLDPTEISFSQATVRSQTSDEIPHSELVELMQQNGWQGAPIDVVNMPDGAPTSMDNRRLLAAREAGIPIQANVRDASDPLSPADIDRFSVQGYPIPTNWGEAIQLRAQRQGDMRGVDPSWPEKFPNGSLYDPDITGQ